MLPVHSNDRSLAITDARHALPAVVIVECCGRFGSRVLEESPRTIIDSALADRRLHVPGMRLHHPSVSVPL